MSGHGLIPRPAVTAAALPRALAYVFNDWWRLPGAEVDVHRGGKFIRRGTVDAATDDGEIIWLAQRGVLERVLIDKTEGYEIWISPAQLQPV